MRLTFKNLADLVARMPDSRKGDTVTLKQPDGTYAAGMLDIDFCGGTDNLECIYMRPYDSDKDATLGDVDNLADRLKLPPLFTDGKPLFSEGDKVQWSSASGGRARDKVGTVVAVIPPKQAPISNGLYHQITDKYKCTRNIDLTPRGRTRAVVSYFVLVEQENKPGILYWPLSHYLSKVEE